MGVIQCIDCSKCKRTCLVRVIDGEPERTVCDSCHNKETSMTDYGEPWDERYEPINGRVEIVMRSDGHVVGYLGNMLFSRRQRVLKCVNACRGITDPEKVVPLMVEVLEFIAQKDLFDIMFWRTDGKYAPVTFILNTSDLLAWGCADAEEINTETFPLLKQAIEDCEAIDPIFGAIEGCSLFSCRVKEMRPQGVAYPENRELWPLFDACGPKREIGIGNPYPPGGKDDCLPL